MSTVSLILAVIGAVFASAIVLVFKAQRRTINQQKRTLDYYADNYLQLSGCDQERSWNFRSFDGGLHWYDSESSADGFRIIGQADMVKVNSVLAMTRLMEHVTNHGPLNLGNPQDVGMLTSAGFTISKKAS